MSTDLNTLTETQILSEIRKAFAGISMQGIDTDAFIRESSTLEELIIKLKTAIEFRDKR